MTENKTKQFRVYPGDYEKIAGFMAEKDIGSNSDFMHFVAENLSRIGATAPTDGDMFKNNETQVEVYPEDYEKIQECMIENNICSDSDFLHFVAENLSVLFKKNPAAGDTEDIRQGAAEGTSPDGNTDGVTIHGKFLPALFPNESWEAEDRRYYFKWVENNLSRGLRFDLQKDFDGMRTWKTDYEGNPKEKTPYGYYSKRFLQWHTWPVFPELWPNLSKPTVIFPECEDPEYQEALRHRYHDPFANTNLRHREKYCI